MKCVHVVALALEAVAAARGPRTIVWKYACHSLSPEAANGVLGRTAARDPEQKGAQRIVWAAVAPESAPAVHTVHCNGGTSFTLAKSSQNDSDSQILGYFVLFIDVKLFVEPSFLW